MIKPKTKKSKPFINSCHAEVVLVALAVIILFILFAQFVPASPNSSDIQLYHQIGLKSQKVPFVLNRYFHIYLQRLFMLVAKTPMQGFAWFWAFLYSSTIGLVYFVARKLNKKGSIVAGLLAVLFFVGAYFLPDIIGVSYVDVTAMFLGMLIVSSYLMSLDNKKAWLIVLGVFIFLGFKTKETTLPISAVILLLGWHQEKFDFKYWWSKVRWVLLGILIGVFVMGILNQIFVKDFLFGYRLSDIQEFIKTYIPESEIVYGNDIHENWYYSFWFKFALLSFVFYILSGVTNKKESSFIRILWLTPLAVTLFILLTINNRWGFLTRFILPATPLLSALSVYFLDFDGDLKLGKHKISHIGGLGIAILVALLILGSTSLYAYLSGLNIPRMSGILFIPLVFSLLLGLMFVAKRNTVTNIVLIACVIAIMAFPLARNVKHFATVSGTQEQWRLTTGPLTAFSENIEVTKDMVFCYDYSTAPENSLTIIKNIDELNGIFDILMGSNTTRENYRYGTFENLLEEDNTTQPCTYILTTTEQVSSHQEVVDTLLDQGYIQKQSADQSLHFYIKK